MPTTQERYVVRWLGIAAIAGAPLLALGSAAPPRPLAAATLLSIGFALVAIGRGCGGLDEVRGLAGLRARLCLALLLATLAAAFQLGLARAELSGAAVPGAAAALAPLVGLAWPSADACGDLAVHSHEGALLVRPSVVKLALLPWASLWAAGLVALLLEPRRRLATALWTLGIAGAALARLCLAVVRFAALEGILSGSGQSKLEVLVRPLETVAWLAGTAALLALLRWRFLPATAPAPARVSARPAGTPRSALLLGAGAALLLLAVAAEPLASPKHGRVLVDDRLSGIWAPAARRLTTGWYGDFPTYSFASAVELLGYHFATTVNADLAYDDALLAEHDVLILKTPVNDVSVAEHEAILRFVHRGGGLLLIGDHTDLMGTSTRLNAFAAPAGIRFRFDSVMDGTHGGFSSYERPALLAHPAVRRVRTTEMMTSCSLELGESARPVLVIPAQMRQAGDYAGGSFFGGLHSDPRGDLGPVVVAAAGTLGRGRVLAFADSTVLSSFALFTFDRERLLLDAVAYLSTMPAGALLDLCLAALGALAALLGLRGVLAMPLVPRIVVLSLVLPAAAATSLALADQDLERRFPRPRPAREVPRAALWLGDAEADIPPVLGTPEGQRLDWAYDTWLAAIPRSGVLPLVTDAWDEALAQRALIVLNPRGGVDARRAAALRSWVATGGKLLLALRRDHYHLDAAQSYLRELGITLAEGQGEGQPFRVEGMEPVASSTPRLDLHRRRFGRGCVLLVRGAEWWSRESLGHCFHVPGTDQRRCYETLAQALDELGLAPRHRRTYRILER